MTRPTSPKLEALRASLSKAIDARHEREIEDDIRREEEHLRTCPFAKVAKSERDLDEYDRLLKVSADIIDAAARALGIPKSAENKETILKAIRELKTTLAKVTAERDAERAHVITLNLHKKEGIEALNAAKAELARLTDAHAVVSQRLAGSQKEVAEVSAERDEATARATKAEARVKRLRKSINAAHAVLDEAGIGLEVEGSPRWTLARRCRAAVEPVWGYLDALQAFDVVGEIVGVTGKTGERGFMDAVIARVKALHQEDTDLLRLVSYHQAPVKFADRPLTLAERASFVIRRLWQGRTNAANEATSLRRELSDIADALGDLPDTAEREPIGDREEHLGLSTAERIRLSR